MNDPHCILQVAFPAAKKWKAVIFQLARFKRHPRLDTRLKQLLLKFFTAAKKKGVKLAMWAEDADEQLNQLLRTRVGIPQPSLPPIVVVSS